MVDRIVQRVMLFSLLWGNLILDSDCFGPYIASVDVVGTGGVDSNAQACRIAWAFPNGENSNLPLRGCCVRDDFIKEALVKCSQLWAKDEPKTTEGRMVVVGKEKGSRIISCCFIVTNLESMSSF